MGIKAGIIALAASFTPHAEAAEPAAQPPRICEMQIGDFDADAAHTPPPPLLGQGVTHITLTPQGKKSAPAAPAPETPAPRGCT